MNSFPTLRLMFTFLCCTKKTDLEKSSFLFPLVEKSINLSNLADRSKERPEQTDDRGF